ncbi:ATP-binding protein [Frankia sp. AgKG'84/4]|uniref:ATP-binding protein n=1 Tax=Frankia sp. AgKG'84/4 TaxID=573490 RepID=UPI00200D3AFB|nr:ATP-binding protein [Frankia sp. AgKG'84/4]MCL9794934.1 AAA family ATPase [Frankia sp. AgKG'84/4]
MTETDLPEPGELASAPAIMATPIAELAAARLAAAALPESVKAVLREASDAVERPAASAMGQIHLESITVAGYRGIGAPARLSLPAAPGVTLVVGRNGSGKSSLAEGAETAFLGTNTRWQRQDDPRRGAWRNRHELTRRPRIELALTVGGSPATLTRTWPGDDFTTSDGVFQRRGQPAVPAAQAGWARAAAEYRPFLSYADLGQLIDDKAVRQYDVVDKILGLGYLTAVDGLLKAEQSQHTAAVKTVNSERATLTTALEALLLDLPEEARAEAALKAMARKPGPDLAALERLLADLPSAQDGDLAELRQLADLQGPDLDRVDEAARRLRDALAAATAVTGTNAEDASLRAELLSQALRHRERHAGGEACPVCGTERVLDDAWARRAAAQITELLDESRVVRTANARLLLAETGLKTLIVSPPAVPPALAAVWQAWEACRARTDLAALADEALGTARTLVRACAAARDQARVLLAERDDRWRPLLASLQIWTEQARAVNSAKARRSELKKARDWLDALIQDLRRERLATFEVQAQDIWAKLRHESSISLTKVGLDGKETSTLRRLILDVSVDDADASALAVMSQGELHALALALFLPRARTADSPFGFLLIDDPVQSMDPAKVNGLAQVLSELGNQRQIVVFTHDTRLQRAFTGQGLPVTIRKVERGKASKVEIENALDPVEQALREARGFAHGSGKLPAAARTHVLPGLCRIALENAFTEAAWLRHHQAGGAEPVFDAALSEAEKLTKVAALAFFGDAKRSDDVYGELTDRCGDWAVKVVQDCQQGAHGSGAQIEDPLRFVDLVGHIAKTVRRSRPAA